MSRTRTFAVVLAVAVMSGQRLHAQPDSVLSNQKISDTEGGFTGTLDDGDWFGNSMASLGDLDGDGVQDLAVGAFSDDDGGRERGAVWILFLQPDGTVNSHQKISDTEGSFTGTLSDFDRFGTSVASLGDLDGAGPSVLALAVGARGDDDGVGVQLGALWIVFLNPDGTVNSHQKISSIAGGGPPVSDDDRFGSSVGSLGDLDGDGVGDLAVGARDDDDGGVDSGAVWVLFLNPDGSVKAHQKISSTAGGGPPLSLGDQFGVSVASLGDLNGDGVGDLAVGARRDDDGGVMDRGAVWVLFLNVDTTGPDPVVTVTSHQKISSTVGGGPPLGISDHFGRSAGWLGDLDGDGVGDLAVGASLDDDGGFNHGAVWVLFLKPDGTVNSHQKISDLQGGFTGTLDDSDSFGRSVASLGDLDGDGVQDLAVGAYKDDDGGSDRGAVWVLFLDGVAACPWDCGGGNDGNVGIVDFLALLADWNNASACDFDGGGVGITDFLELLANWGPCP